MWEKAKTALKMFDTVVHGLETIQRITKTGGPQAAVALAAIDGVITSILDGFSGKATPDAVHLEIQQLEAQLASHDARTDAAIDAATKKLAGDAP